MRDAIDQFQNAIMAARLTPPADIEPDGKLHRFSSNGKKGDDSGWYVLHGDSIPAGSFGDWRTGISQSWRADIGRALSPQEEAAHKTKIEAMRREREAEEVRRHEEAQRQAEAIWQATKPVTEHPYLTRKGVKAYALRVKDGRLIVPMRDGGVIHSLQSIGADGDKLFLPGGRVKGCYFSIGKPSNVLCIVEGYATGASIHEATGHAVAVAFNAGNLLPVAKAIRAKFPDLRLIVCADDDTNTDGNPGLTKAREAALSIGGMLAVPTFGTVRPDGASDFNDLHQAQGLEAVKRCIAGAEAIATTKQQQSAAMPSGIEYARNVELIRGSDITPEAVTWLWQGWLAAGKMHVLGGAPGTGKTTISMALAATVTTGGRWPDGSRSPAGNVVIWSGEDDPADTLIPRLALSGADLARVYFIADVFEGSERRSFDPAKDMEPLRRKLEEVGDIRLLIVDPIVSAIAGDSHKNAEVRRGLQPLADLAASMRCALLGITHFSKGTGGRDPVERLTGSLAFGALARVVLVAAKHQEEGEDGRTVRLFLRAKSNIGPDDGGFEYDLHQGEMKTFPGIFSSSVLWGNAVEGAARELLATAETMPEDDGSEGVVSVAEWLNDLLTEEGGRIDRRDVMKAAHAMGHKERTVHRAREKLRLTVQQHGFGKDKRSVWTWPDPTMPASIVPTVPNKLSGTHGTIDGTHEGNSIVEVEL